jgi:hypothetical protein
LDLSKWFNVNGYRLSVSHECVYLPYRNTMVTSSPSSIVFGMSLRGVTHLPRFV